MARAAETGYAVVLSTERVMRLFAALICLAVCSNGLLQHSHVVKQQQYCRPQLCMAVRARELRTQLSRRNKIADASLRHTKDAKAARREGRAAFRRLLANSGKQLELLKDDPAWYVGVIGLDGAGRAKALKNIETALKQATELKIGKKFVRFVTAQR